MKPKPKTTHPHERCDLHGLANRLHTDSQSLRRALDAAGLKPSPSGTYDCGAAAFLWLASQVKKSPTRTFKTNIQLTTKPC